jgi:type VI secretion system protein ImpH
VAQLTLSINMHAFEVADVPDPSTERLLAYLDAVAQHPSHFDLFQTLRRVEALSPQHPRLGDALRPQHEPIRFAQNPELTFAIGAIETVRLDAPTPQLLQRVFGLLGPNGALPIHLTEYARERQLHEGDVTFLAFLNHLQHRFGLFFYRAWARAQPVVSLDRPHESRLIQHLSALLGLPASASMDQDLRKAVPTRRIDDTVPRYGEEITTTLGSFCVSPMDDALGLFPKLHWVGRLARSVRDADGLQAWISSHFGWPVVVETFCAHWMHLSDEERLRLRHQRVSGSQTASAGALGRGAVLGQSVWDVQHKFRIVIGPLAWVDYVALQIGQPGLAELQALVRHYVGLEFEWDLRLILRPDEMPRGQLGRVNPQKPGAGRLGQTAWL